MNKEVIIAIAIGIGMGIIGALVLNSTSLKATKKASVPNNQIAEVTALPSPKKVVVTEYRNVPKNGSVVSTDKVSIIIKPPEKRTFVFNSYKGIVPETKDKEFKKTFILKPGYNEIVIAEHDKKALINTKIVSFYYMPRQEALSSPIEQKKNKATGEAEILKRKLEKKVLELRYRAKKAVYGAVELIGPEKIIIKPDNEDKISVKLEPEVTRFYDIKDNELSEVVVDDIQKGDVVSVFISSLPDEDKSYTVYRETPIGYITGKIAEVLKSSFQLSVINVNKTTMKYDIETKTDQTIYNLSSENIEQGGFSKLKIGDYIYAQTQKGRGNASLASYLVINN